MREIRIPGLRRVLVIGWSERALRREISDEIRFHIDERIAELVRLGASQQDARRRAEDEYGDVTASERELADVDRRRRGHEQREEIMVSFFEDLRYAARGLLRQPSLLVATTLALSIGIAANAIMFGVVDQLLIRPPAHVAAPEELRRLYFKNYYDQRAYTSAVTVYPAINALMRNASAVEVAAFEDPDPYTLGRGTDAQKVDVQLASGNFFQVLGVTLAQGRGFAPGEDSIPRGAQVVVISDGFWRRELGASEALGRVLTINGIPFTVIGIAPRGFSGIDRENVDIWVPVSAMAPHVKQPDWHSAPNSWFIQGFVRLKPDTDPERATAQATLVYRNEARTWSGRPGMDTTGSVLLGSIIGTRSPEGLSRESKVSLWLMGVSAIVLLIACANVANLLIARMLQRRLEIAVRLALGVSRWRLLRMLLTESALLAVIASGIAVVIAIGASRLVQDVLLPGIVWSDSVLDARVLLFTLAVTVLCILLAGIAPALEGLGTRVAESLKASARTFAAGRNRLRFALVVLQTALSVVLVIGAGLFVRSLRNVTGKDVGIDLNRVLLVTTELDRLGFSKPTIEDIYRRGHARISAMPGVATAGIVRQSVPTAMGHAMGFTVPRVERFDFEGGGPYYSVVGSDFFPTLGTSVATGRNFTPGEERESNRSMIVTKVVAEAYWPGKDPIGQCAQLGDDKVCSTIVGVVENVMLFQMVKDDRAMIYIPPGHATFGDAPPAAMVVRAEGDPAALISLVRREMQALAPGMPFVAVDPYVAKVAPQLRPWRLGATMFTLFGVIALIIAAVGLYSVLAFWVSQRTHEIGVRMALGAQRADVIRLVALQTAAPIGLGLLIGIASAALGSRWIAGMLYETSPRDPLVFGIAALALALAALIAGVIPARRSASVDPAKAIRTE